MKRIITKICLALTVFQLVSPFLIYIPEARAAQMVKRYVKFSDSSLVDTKPASSQNYSASTKTVNINLSDSISGTVSSWKLFKADGSPITSGSSSTLSYSIPGEGKDVYGMTVAKPMHQIYRDPNGSWWAHKGEKTPYVEFQETASGFPSKYPGLIPNIGRRYDNKQDFFYRDPGSTEQDKGKKYGPDLRYTYDSDQYKTYGTQDLVKDYSKEGYAVTTAYEVERPKSWWMTSSEARDLDSGPIKNSDIDLNTIQIYSAAPNGLTKDVQIVSVGQGDKQYGLIRVMGLLDGNWMNRNEYGEDTGTAPHGLLRNYYMFADAKWKAKTYDYNGIYVEITYDPPATADLAAVEIITTTSCIQVGDTVTFTYKYRNNGANTNTSFNVSIELSGNAIKSETSAGLGVGQVRQGTFTYKFENTIEKSFYLHVDKSNAVGEPEGTRSNNSLNKKYTAQSSSCDDGGGDGELEGTVDADKSYMPWRDMNLVIVTVNDQAASCKAKQFQLQYLDTHGNETQIPWVDTGVYQGKGEGSHIFWFDEYTQSYLGKGILSGEITVHAWVKDSCGGTSYIGFDKFTIGDAPPIQPPTIEIEWFEMSDLSTPVTRTVIDTPVMAKITKLEDPQRMSISREWIFNDDTEWIAAIPSKVGLTLPYKGESVSNIVANELGYHTICVYATNGKRGGNGCSTLQVVPPNPVPIIEGGTFVKENRTLTPPLSTSKSYSPVRGRSIDHSRDETTGLWATSYSVPGDYELALHVYDNTGLKSLAPDTHKITVTPDHPPINRLKYEEIGIRGQSYTLRNESYSGDGDRIDVYRVEGGYDDNNDNSCSSYSLLSTDNQDFTFSPTKVGKYCFRVYAQEDYGKNSTTIYVMDVINDSPEGSFSISGEVQIPEPPIIKIITGEQAVGMTKSTLDSASIKSNYIVNSVGNLLSTNAGSCTYQDTVDFEAANGGLGNYACPEETYYKYSYTTAEETSSGYEVISTKSINNKIYGSTTDVFVVPINEAAAIVYKGTPSDDDSDDDDTEYELACAVRISDGRNYSCTGNYYSDDDDSSSSRSWIYINPQTGNWAIAMNRNGTGEGGGFTDDNYYFYDFYLATYGPDNQQRSYNHCYKNWYSSGGDKWGMTTEGECDVPFYFDGFEVDATGIKGNESGRIKFVVVNSTQAMFSDASYDPVVTNNTNPDGSTAFGSREGQKSGFSNQDYSTHSLYNYTSNTILRYYGKLGTKFIYTKWFHVIGRNEGMPIYAGDKTSPDNLVCPAPATLSRYVYIYRYSSASFRVPSDPNTLYIKFSYNGSEWDDEDDDFEGREYPKYLVKDYVLKLQPNGSVTCEEGAIPREAVIEKVRPLNMRPYVMDYPVTPYPGLKRFPGDLLFDGVNILKINTNKYQPDATNEHYVNGMVRTMGQLSSNESYKNLAVKANFRFYHSGRSDVPAGVILRMVDHKNMYRVEVDAREVRLFKIVDGRKTLLAAKSIKPVGTGWVDLKARAIGDQIKVYVGGLPLIDVFDSTFSNAGSYGLFTDMTFTEFKPLVVEIYKDNTEEETLGVVLVNEPAKYQTFITDPENDPIAAGLTEWSVEHTDHTVFLDQGDGYWGRVELYRSNTEQPVFPKVGKYRIGYRIFDDPQPDHLYPDLTFHEYRKGSPTYYTDITVHRKPIARLSVALNGDGTLSYQDRSYDPDRCYDNLSCQAGYTINKGIIERKYYYISPSGVSTQSMPTKPTEYGTYEIFLTVKDEYGAWSDWTSTSIFIESPVTNNPPSASLTFPDGAEFAPSVVLSVKPVISFTMSDPDPGTIFYSFEMEVKNAGGTCVVCKVVPISSNAGPYSWTLDKELTPGAKYQVRVRVSDDAGATSGWTNVGWMLVNDKPSVTITSPDGSVATPTLILSEDQPIIYWTQTDNEVAQFNWFSIEVRREDGSLIFPTPFSPTHYYQGTTSATNQFQIPMKLPTKEKLQVRMFVTDHADIWSDPSNTVWLIINYPPTVTMTFPTGSQANPTPGNPTPLITWTRSDPDSDTAFTKRRILIRNEAATVSYVDETIVQSSTATSGSYQVTTPLPAGQKVRVTVMEWDEFTESSWAAETWMITNRPPLADFDWSPSPVWEGDTVTLHNRSSDPDGDSLTALWEIRKPNGELEIVHTWDVVIPFLLIGDYDVRLTVHDGSISHSAVKVIPVNELLLLPEVEHTAAWLQIHQDKGHQTEIPPKDFYSGEILVVRVETSPVPTVSVSAWIDSVSEDGEAAATEALLSSDGTSGGYRGELFDESWMEIGKGLPQGVLQVHFRVEYSNGIVKEKQVPIRIIGHVYESVGVHRVQ
jgi:hypothetical protein